MKLIEFTGTPKEKFWVTVAIISMIAFGLLVMFPDIFTIIIIIGVIVAPVAIWVKVFEDSKQHKRKD